MTSKTRLNKVIELLEEGKPAFGTIVNNGNIDELVRVAHAGYDFVVIENEHVGVDFGRLRISLQFLLSRNKLADQGNLQANPTPFVRISPNSEEIASNQWVIKQTLDHGPYGLVLPRMESVEAASASIRACRYVQLSDARDVAPEGERGWDPRVAAGYWGVSIQDYTRVADLWPLDPDGELLVVALCETARGVKNLPDILSQTQGIGMVWVATGDLAVSMGVGPNPRDPEVEDALLSSLEVCRRHGVPCAVVASSSDELDQRIGQGFQVFFALHQESYPVLEYGRRELGL